MTENIVPFDRNLLALRRKRALTKCSTRTDFLLKATIEDFKLRLGAVNRQFNNALDLSGHTGLVSNVLKVSGKVSNVIRADPLIPDLTTGHPTLVLDEEFLPFSKSSFDLIVSVLTLQWVNDLPGTLLQIRNCLKPDGLFLGVLIGGESLTELRNSFLKVEAELYGGTSPRIAPFIDTHTLGLLLMRAGFALPVVDQDSLIVRYDNAHKLMSDLKSMGASNILTERSRKPATRTLLTQVVENYQNQYSDSDGRIRATFQTISLSGWAPHESQQQPLKPGSAKFRLEDSLKKIENSH